MEYSCFQFWSVQNSRRTPAERIRHIGENSFGGRQPHDIGVAHEQQVQNLRSVHILSISSNPKVNSDHLRFFFPLTHVHTGIMHHLSPLYNSGFRSWPILQRSLKTGLRYKTSGFTSKLCLLVETLQNNYLKYVDLW